MEGRADPAIHEALLAQALEHAPFAVSVFDEDGNYVAVNERVCELTGYTREELLTMGPLNVTADDSERARRNFDEALAGRLRGGIARIRKKDGEVIEVAYRIGSTTVGGLPFLIRIYWETAGEEPGPAAPGEQDL